jgi:prepilin-type N-terminal cleavage/methylation domain-containing protein
VPVSPTPAGVKDNQGVRMRQLQRTKTRSVYHRGFTLIELLIVILILSVLMAVALPLYVAAVNQSERAVCRSNMQTIANGEQAFRARDPQHEYTTNLADLPLDLGSIPVCPRGGTYSVSISDGNATANNGQSVPVGSVVVECSEASHGVFAPSIDSE